MASMAVAASRIAGIESPAPVCGSVSWLSPVDGAVVGVSLGAGSGAPKLIIISTVLAETVAASVAFGNGAAAIMHCTLVQSVEPKTSFTVISNAATLPLASAFLNVAPVAVLQSAGPA